MDTVIFQFIFVAMVFLSAIGIVSLFTYESPPPNPDKKFPYRAGPEIDSMRRVYAAWAEYKRVKDNETKKARIQMGCKDR